MTWSVGGGGAHVTVSDHIPVQVGLRAAHFDLPPLNTV